MLSPPPVNIPLTTGDGISDGWARWIMEAHRYISRSHGAGTTALRPNNAVQTGDWYFDTTLSKPIWYSGSGWIDATGAPA